MIFYEVLWQVPVAVILAVIVHEGGHLLGALAVGLTPRLLTVGLGPTVLRWRRMKVIWVLRAVPITGYILVEQADRRWPFVLMVAGGPLANAAALAVCVWLHGLRPDWDLVVAVAIYQGLFAVAVMIPTTGTIAGLRVPTDGLRLYRLLRAGRLTETADAYASMMSHVMTKGAAPHPVTRQTGPILFEVARPDRFIEARARQEACAALRSLLGRTDLTRAERAFILCFLASMECLYGTTGASPATIEEWTEEALTLAPEPMPRATRGDALLAAGRQSEADALLREALAGFEARGEGAGAQAVLCRASLGHAASVAGCETEARAWFAEAESAPVARDKRVRELITLVKLKALRSRPAAAGHPVQAAEAG